MTEEAPPCAECQKCTALGEQAKQAGNYRAAADYELLRRPAPHPQSADGDGPLGVARMKEPTPHKGPRPGQDAYDAATGRAGVLQAVCHISELAFDHGMPGPLVAFLRPEKGGQEWTTDPGNIRFPQ